ncbi:ferritin-like domain-containing protein [Amphritea sp. 1_MG-2023]|uniref:ferritin-like domain-containing protein n=1 Tax=Amphritea sp. 1_MG-2023 TaxID=3062670 RepID=UPI0026E3D294|nr:ferritin-like domain-containing protein [Amphritea sp. 1_MG-2023]MDO6565116.1 ferritin-like domain-containing protein [Amphritea sp. 1_MG-2023]
MFLQNLYARTKEAFLTADPDLKIELTRQTVSRWNAGELEWQEGDAPEFLQQPGQLDKPEIVAPAEVNERKMSKEEGRAALIHALAHIELTAVNLALDSVHRYRHMPKAFYADWMQCAAEEANHFVALRGRLREMGYDYGSFKAHGELWSMAIDTADDMLERMGIVHRALEARALDVVPKAIQRFDQLGDNKMVDILSMIGNEEIGHVCSGTRWYHYQCQQRHLEPNQTFIDLLWKYMKGPLKGPLNYEARLKAGFSAEEMKMIEMMKQGQ